MIFTVATTRITDHKGWSGTRSLPTFYVEAVTPYEAAVKASEILTGGTDDAVNCALTERDNPAAEIHEFVALGGTPMALRPIG
jgi:hypothetical protein